MKLNLEAKSDIETLLLTYLEDNASEMLAEKINAGKKTLAGCYSFIRDEARKRAISGTACIEDKVVYGWCIHYFEEDSLDFEIKKAAVSSTVIEAAVRRMERETEESIQRTAARASKAQKPKQEEKKKDEGMEGQMSFMDLFADGGAWEDISDDK